MQPWYAYATGLLGNHFKQLGERVEEILILA